MAPDRLSALRARRPARPALLLLLLMVSGLPACDSGPGLEDPSIDATLRLVLEEPVTLQAQEAGKRSGGFRTAADYTVDVDIVSLAGEDFSPEPFVVSDGERETRLTLSLPAGESYRLSVAFSRGNTVAARGQAVHYLSRETEEIVVPIIPFTPETAIIGFVPGLVREKAGASDMLTLDLRYFAGNTPISGLACIVKVEGIDVSQLAFDGAALVRFRANQVNLSWAWESPEADDRLLGTLSVPRAAAGTIRFEIAEGDARSVDPDGAITRLEAVGATVEILP